MKDIYIVLSQTGTILSRIVRLFTRAEYCHSSISLDEGLRDMYSFGRLNPYNPVWGGLVRESPDRGTFRRFYKSTALLLRFSVEDEKYEEIKQDLEDMYSRRGEYGYNYLGLFLASVNKKHTGKNRFYCSEFVHYVMSEHGIYDKALLPEIVHPIDFYNAFKDREVYRGMIADFRRV